MKKNNKDDDNEKGEQEKKVLPNVDVKVGNLVIAAWRSVKIAECMLERSVGS